MYISRYAINSWVFLSRAQKDIPRWMPAFIISICPVCGIVGTIFSGVISDKLFGGRRNVPALILAGLMMFSSTCSCWFPAYTFG